jgi:hypothetical protein
MSCHFNAPGSSIKSSEIAPADRRYLNRASSREALPTYSGWRVRAPGRLCGRGCGSDGASWRLCKVEGQTAEVVASNLSAASVLGARRDHAVLTKQTFVP